jgi:hypothetical protein
VTDIAPATAPLISVSDLVVDALQFATADTGPLPSVAADRIRQEVTAALGEVIEQLAAENAELRTALSIRAAASGYIRAAHAEAFTARDEARRMHRRWAGAVAQARHEHARAELLRQALDQIGTPQ